MRWYLNDASLQGQFALSQGGVANASADTPFEAFLRELLAVRPHISRLHVARTLHSRPVSYGVTLRTALQKSDKVDLKRAVLSWLDRDGPFIEDDRQFEADDLFECCGMDVTESGLGEAARRSRVGQPVQTFSLPGGQIDFACSPLLVDHGLSGERLGVVRISNVWTIYQLRTAAADDASITSWRDLVAAARTRFPHLLIPDAVYEHKMLAREAYSHVIAQQTLKLLGHLDTYMANRSAQGSESAAARDIVRSFFAGERAAFTGESETNQRRFSTELTFATPGTPTGFIFAHWHGKISHRYFRLHFEWPVPREAETLRVVYLGPKLTKD